MGSGFGVLGSFGGYSPLPMVDGNKLRKAEARIPAGCTGYETEESGHVRSINRTGEGFNVGINGPAPSSAASVISTYGLGYDIGSNGLMKGGTSNIGQQSYPSALAPSMANDILDDLGSAPNIKPTGCDQ